MRGVQTRSRSPVFQALVAMKEGDAVRFSGTFIRDEADCVREGSMSLSGSMTEPEFIMRFSAAAPAK
jgi:hypothetical protein